MVRVAVADRYCGPTDSGCRCDGRGYSGNGGASLNHCIKGLDQPGVRCRGTFLIRQRISDSICGTGPYVGSGKVIVSNVSVGKFST